VGLDEALTMVESGEIHEVTTQVTLLAYDRGRT
jgi:hypothetical protein